MKWVRDREAGKNPTVVLLRQFIGNKFGLKPVNRTGLAAKLQSSMLYRSLAILTEAEIDRELITGLLWIVKHTLARR
ncbi:hypothetical protein CYG49_03245 [Candidatus Saccharibacteria bacterium]|nr:MAG: hypothetical protein CYG49_03245 [Candidatus Saccharibacteria bacterium]